MDVELRDICKRLGGKQVLHKVNLTVASGSIYGLLGPNGAGKTTLIKIMVGLLKPDSGNGTLLGQSLNTDRSRFFAEISYLAEKVNLYEDLTVKQLFFLQQGLSSTWSQSFALELMGKTGINLEDDIEILSKGQQRLLQLIIAAAPQPRLMILDEPFEGLDPAKQRWVVDTILKQVVNTGCSVFFSSHHLDHVERLCDQIGILVQGRMKFSGSPASLQEKLGKPLTDCFIDLINQEGV